MVAHRTLAELEAGLDAIRRSPAQGGRLVMIVRRLAIGEREVLEEGKLDLLDGLVGDTWRMRGSARTQMGHRTLTCNSTS